METIAEIIGVYPIQADQPVHLLEIFIKGSKGKINISEFTQEISGQPKEYWQVPWNESIMNEVGEKIIAREYKLLEKPDSWIGNIRLVFFFHYLDLSKPFLTPFGPIALPKESPQPERLLQIAYEPPD